MIEDTLAAVISVLKADSGVSTLVSTRVYGGEMPEDDAPDMPQKSIVCRYAGSGVQGENDFVEVNEPRIDLFCYGENPYEADRVRRASFQVMKELSREVVNTTTLLHRANHSGGPISLRDGDTGWPLVIESWLVLAGNTAFS